MPQRLASADKTSDETGRVSGRVLQFNLISAIFVLAPAAVFTSSGDSPLHTISITASDGILKNPLTWTLEFPKDREDGESCVVIDGRFAANAARTCILAD